MPAKSEVKKTEKQVTSNEADGSDWLGLSEAGQAMVDFVSGKVFDVEAPQTPDTKTKKVADDEDDGEDDEDNGIRNRTTKRSPGRPSGGSAVNVNFNGLFGDSKQSKRTDATTEPKAAPKKDETSAD